MNRSKKYAVLAAFTICLVFAVLFATPAFAARIPGDIDNDGRITAADARLWLRVSAKLEKLEDYYTPEELEGYIGDEEPAETADANFEVGFSVADGGYFIGGESKAVITITADANVKSAELSVIDAADTTVYKTTVRDIKKDTPVEVEWDGKTGSGEYVGSGDYSVSVGSGENAVKTESLYFTAKNYFSDGNGSETHPFLIETKEDIENVIRYPKAYFKQVKDIDYDFATAKSMFTTDMPFKGVYDGNNKKISNIKTNDALFTYVGEDGILKNMVFENASFVGLGGLSLYNYGNILNCSFDAVLSVSLASDRNEFMGMIVSRNYGLIRECKCKGSIAGKFNLTNTFNWHDGFLGGIAGYNNGRILDCSTNVDIKGSSDHGYRLMFIGGINGFNDSSGLIQNNECNCVITFYSKNSKTAGGISARNDGQIKNCVYTGSSDVKLAGTGSGIVA